MDIKTFIPPDIEPGFYDKNDMALVQFLHLLAADALRHGEKYVSTWISDAAVALDEYRSGQRLAYPALHSNWALIPKTQLPDMGPAINAAWQVPPVEPDCVQPGGLLRYCIADTHAQGGIAWRQCEGIVQSVDKTDSGEVYRVARGETIDDVSTATAWIDGYTAPVMSQEAAA